MKKAVVLTLAAFLLAFGFLLELKPEPAKPPDTLTLTFVSPFANSNYWSYAAQGIIDQCAARQISVKCIGFSESDPDQQIRYIKSAVYSQVDAIITAGIEDSQEFQNVLDMASTAGIPVILIDCDIPDSNRLCYVGTDNYAAGCLAGEQIVEATGGSGSVAVLKNSNSSVNQEERIQGFESAIAQSPGLEIVTILEGDQEFMVMKQKLVQMMKEFPQLTAIFCAEGYSGGIVSKFLLADAEECPLRGLSIVTFDLNENIQTCLENKTLCATIQQDPYTMGKTAIEYLASYLSGQRDIPDTFYTEARTVNAENLSRMPYEKAGEIPWYVY